MRTKTDAFIGDFAQRGQAENLIAAGIGENRIAPGHEGMEAAELANQLVARTQIKVIGIGENDARAQFFERVLRKSLDRGGSAHRHEDRRFDYAVRRGQLAAPRSRGRIALQYLKCKTHPSSVSGENKGQSHAHNDVDEEGSERDNERLCIPSAFADLPRRNRFPAG